MPFAVLEFSDVQRLPLGFGSYVECVNALAMWLVVSVPSPHFPKYLVLVPSLSPVTKIFHTFTMTSLLTNVEHFQEFSENPKSSTKETILGSIQYVEDQIVGKAKGLTCPTLIHIFNRFEGQEDEDDQTREYMYRRMKRSVLLELALAILKEIRLN